MGITRSLCNPRNLHPPFPQHRAGTADAQPSEMVVSHQAGTVRFGNEPSNSALGLLCKAWNHDNLYVVDAGFFPSSAAVNAALTVAAQGLRVGTHLRDRIR